MSLDDKYIQFMAKRKKLARTWPVVGTVLLAVLIAFLAWLYYHNPLLVNPFEIISRLEKGTVEQSTLVLMAVLLPFMFLTCFVLLAALVLFVFSAFSAEKRHMRAVDMLLEGKPPDGEEGHRG